MHVTTFFHPISCITYCCAQAFNISRMDCSILSLWFRFGSLYWFFLKPFCFLKIVRKKKKGKIVLIRMNYIICICQKIHKQNDKTKEVKICWLFISSILPVVCDPLVLRTWKQNKGTWLHSDQKQIIISWNSLALIFRLQLNMLLVFITTRAHSCLFLVCHLPGFPYTTY